MEIVLGLIALLLVIAAVTSLRSRRTAPTDDTAAGGGLRAEPPHRDFRIVGDEAHVFFDIEVPNGEADEALQVLLIAEAHELLRVKRTAGLAVEHVTLLRAFGRDGGTEVEVGSSPTGAVDEPESETGQGVAAPREGTGSDPLALILDGSFHGAEATALPSRSDELPPLGDELRLTQVILDALDREGVDPKDMTAGELALGLLRHAGYALEDAKGADTYVIAKAGSTTFLKVVDHSHGDHPELSDQAISEFLFGFADARTDRGLLVSGKFGPFAIYEKERREPRIRFITRERLQAFVDGFVMGESGA